MLNSFKRIAIYAVFFVFLSYKGVMRKLISLICVLFALSAEAQETPVYRHLFSIDIGYWSLHDFKPETYCSDYDLQWGYGSHAYHNAQYYKEATYHPALVDVNYRYFKSKHWAFGITAGFHTYYQKGKEIASGKTVHEERETNLSIIGSARYYWRTMNWVRTYSEIGIGPCFHWEKGFYDEKYKKELGPIAHLTILGIEVGKGNIIGFGEFGIGTFGIFRGGIGYRF